VTVCGIHISLLYSIVLHAILMLIRAAIARICFLWRQSKFRPEVQGPLGREWGWDSLGGDSQPTGNADAVSLSLSRKQLQRLLQSVEVKRTVVNDHFVNLPAQCALHVPLIRHENRRQSTAEKAREIPSKRRPRRRSCTVVLRLLKSARDVADGYDNARRPTDSSFAKGRDVTR